MEENLYSNSWEPVNEESPTWVPGTTVTPNGNRTTTYDDWQKSNELEKAADLHGQRVGRSTRPIGRFFRKLSNRISTWGLNTLGKIGDFFNKAVTSGAETDFGLTSPFSDMDRREILNSRRRFGRKARRKIEEYSPFLSPTSYLAAIKNDSWDPRYGALIISQLSPETQLGLAALDLFLLGKNRKLGSSAMYGVKKGIGYLTEDFVFPENSRIPLKYGEPSTTEFWKPGGDSDYIKNIRYKVGYDPIDKLMVDDMVSKFKERYKDQYIKGTDADGTYYMDRDFITNGLENLKNDTYYVGDITNADYSGIRFEKLNYVDRFYGDQAVGTHEGIMHGSDRFLLDLSDPYKLFINKLKLPNDKGKSLQPSNWYEFRATLGETKRKILRRINKQHSDLPYDIEKYRPYYIDYINNMSDKKLRRMFRFRNGYGNYYHRHRKNNPNYTLDLRDLLINGM